METDTQPWLWIIGGPNGAGKTTFSIDLLPLYAHVDNYINADLIARGLDPFHPERAAFAAGKLMLSRMDECVSAKKSFAIETTLASLSHLQTCKRLRGQGWRIGLVYLWLESSQLSIDRIAERVRKGGHFIPDDVVRRRRAKSLKLLPSYMEVASTYLLFDNTNRPAQMVAWAADGQSRILVEHVYGRIQRGE